MKRRFKIDIEYDGTNYCGWQRQTNGCSIQFTIEEALRPLNRNQQVTVIGSGRTDSGVHALNQVTHFDLETSLSAESIKNALNAKTPEDIFIHECKEVDSSFHSRFSAVKRTYIYQVLEKPSVIYRYYSWLPKFGFDFSTLNKCAKAVKGKHDFSSLCRSATESESKICMVYKSMWIRKGKMLIYEITGNRFLHSMVRMLVGCMMEVARGKYIITDFKNLLENKVGEMQVYTAPAKGLFLLEVEY